MTTPTPLQPLRTVALPACCGNCRHWMMQAYCDLSVVGSNKPESQWLRTEFNNRCDQHERRSER